MKSELSFDERMALEAAERRERYAALLVLARGVAAAMAGNWTARERENDNDGNAHLDSYRGEVFISNSDGRRLNLSIDQHAHHMPKQRDTLSISGHFDFGDSSLGIGFPYGKSRPSISVNWNRGPVVIAREIERRLLPDYNALRFEITERVAKATAYRDNQSGITARLAALVTGDVRGDRKREFRLYGAGEKNTRHLEVKVSGSEVDVKVENLTEAEAGEVLRLLAPYLAKRKEG